MDLKELFEKQDYMITPTEKIVAKNSSRGYGWAVDIGLMTKGIPVIYYSMTDKEQITEALRLRDLFDKNEIAYQEKPDCLFMAKKLRASVRDVLSLADRLERKIEKGVK